MTATAKLEKAEEFFLLADVSAPSEWDAAVSLAVSAGINAADVIILLKTGNFGGGEHDGAVRTLKRLGYGTEASQLSFLLRLKSTAQYSARRCTLSEAEDCLKRAARLLGSARDVMRVETES